MYGCTGVQVPPPFIHFIPMLWAVLACVAILPTPGNYWNHLEHWCAGPPLSYILFPCSGLCWDALPFSLLLETIGTTWNLYDPRILLDVPHPHYLKCMAALVCRPPPLSYILFPCSGLCWHALPFSLLLETIGTTWNS